MNDHDSERVKDLLSQQGYSFTDEAKNADILLFNTCSVRKHAENRVVGKVASLKKLKQKRPEVIFGILGCMAEAQKEDIFRKLPHVDFVCGPSDLDKVPGIIDRVKSGAGRVVYAGVERSKKIPLFSEERSTGKRAYVKIMQGCSNFCSYCVVPYVRGPEKSRPSKEILHEVKGLLKKKVENITLLGQNVNSYGKGLKEKITFPELLRKIDKAVDGKIEVDFFTSHPKDASPEMFKVMDECKSISKMLHIPLQSGSNRVLKRMNRNYTVEKYKKLVKEYRGIVKGGNISSDFIVGFPGETSKDFEDTLKVVREIGFDASYIFKYSKRPFTKASKFKDDVPQEEIERRHSLLLKVQREIASSKKKARLASAVYFLIGPTASGKTELSIELAKSLNAEVISCDSMCVYKGMDILTSKPSVHLRKRVTHHLIDIIPPSKEFSVSEYRKLALKAIEDILKRKKIPLFVGGSPLYVASIVDGLFSSAAKDEKFRNIQAVLVKKYGNMYLYNKLKKIDPVTASKIHPNNLRYIIRALEIYHTEKKKPSELKKKAQAIKYRVKIFGVKIERDKLYENINARVDEMFEQGILDEVKKLSKKKMSITARGALGYKEVSGYLNGKYALEEAKDLLKKNTRHFAKRQMTWFSRDKRIEWKEPYSLL